MNAKKTIAIVRRDKLQEYKDVFEKRFGPDQRPKEVVILEEMTGVGDAEEELAGDPKEWGSRYLGAGMGGQRFREAYVKEKVERWTASLETLAKVAEVDPQVGYSLLVQGLIPRWKFLMRTTPTEPEWFSPMEEALAGPICEALFCQRAEGDLRRRLKLPCRHGGLAIPDPRELAGDEYNASRRATQKFSEMIADGVLKDVKIQDAISGRKEARLIRTERDKAYGVVKEFLKSNMVGRQRVAFEESVGRGKSGLLTKVPTADSGLQMEPLWFRIGLQLRLGLPVAALPDRCPDCLKKNSIEHALGSGEHGACGGARDRRHDEVCEHLRQLAREAGFWVHKRPKQR